MQDVTQRANATAVSPQLDITAIVTTIFGFFGGSLSPAVVAAALGSFWNAFAVFSYIISTVLLYGAIYAMTRFKRYCEEEQQLLREEEHAFVHAYGKRSKDKRWEGIVEHANTENPNDWRLAVIEADIMLDEALNRAGFLGASVGEKLKGANADSLKSLQDAWNAHKVRNNIAHQGSDFVLTKRAAQEAINQYERVFEELGVI